LRKGLIQLIEGTQYKPDEEDEAQDADIQRYLFNEMLVREICTYIPEE
jgi:hypothetical protein